MKKGILLSSFLFFFFGTIHSVDARNQQYLYFVQSTWEAGLKASYSSVEYSNGTDHEKIDFIYADIEAAYFALDNLSLGLATTWLYVPDVNNKGKVAGYGLEGSVRYHFQVTPNFIPYLGVHAGYYDAKIETKNRTRNDSIKDYGFHGGFKVPINENIYYDTQFKWTEYDISLEDIDISQMQILMGLKVKF